MCDIHHHVRKSVKYVDNNIVFEEVEHSYFWCNEHHCPSQVDGCPEKISLEADGYISIYDLSNGRIVSKIEGIESYKAIKNAINVFDNILELIGQDAKVVSAQEQLENILKL